MHLNLVVVVMRDRFGGELKLRTVREREMS